MPKVSQLFDWKRVLELSSSDSATLLLLRQGMRPSRAPASV